MVNELNPLGPLDPQRLNPLAAPAAGTGKESAPASGTGKSFKDLVMENLAQVNDLMGSKDQAVERLATGQTDNVTEVMTAISKADLAFKTMMQIRNKLQEAYDELNRLRI